MKLLSSKLITGFIVALLLANFYLLFFKEAPPAYAATVYQYKVVKVNASTGSIQEALDQYGSQGWELVAIENLMGHLIFKKSGSS